MELVQAKWNQKVLYWNWSPNTMGHESPVQGWNECLITYVLAASSTSYSIPEAVVYR